MTADLEATVALGRELMRTTIALGRTLARAQTAVAESVSRSMDRLESVVANADLESDPATIDRVNQELAKVSADLARALVDANDALRLFTLATAKPIGGRES